MATIQCQGCGKRVIQRGEDCPHCGEPLVLKKSSKATSQKEEKIVQCEACGKDISKNASSCPHCGEPLPHPPPKKKTSKWTWFVLLLFISWGVGQLSVGKSKTKTEARPECNDFVHLKVTEAMPTTYKRNLWKNSDRSGGLSGSAYPGDKMITISRRNGNYLIVNFSNHTNGWISPIQIDRIEKKCAKP